MEQTLKEEEEAEPRWNKKDTPLAFLSSLTLFFVHFVYFVVPLFFFPSSYRSSWHGILPLYSGTLSPGSMPISRARRGLPVKTNPRQPGQRSFNTAPRVR